MYKPYLNPALFLIGVSSLLPFDLLSAFDGIRSSNRRVKIGGR